LALHPKTPCSSRKNVSSKRSLKYYTLPHKNLDIAKQLDKNLQTKGEENQHKNYIKRLFAYGI